MKVEDIRSHATQMYEQMGPKAIAVAAARAQECEADGNPEGAENWRRIERTLLEQRGPRQP